MHWLYKVITMSKKILIVDEDRLIRESYQEVLKSEGYEVEAALDGREGLNKIIENSYDLVLLDIMLPKLDGIGIIREISERSSKTPISSVIFFTNLSEDPVVKEALQSGVHSCLVKADTSPDQLLTHVQEALGEEPASAGQSNPQENSGKETGAAPKEKSKENLENKSENKSKNKPEDNLKTESIEKSKEKSKPESAAQSSAVVEDL